jgi:hypothetical protein
VTPHRRERHRGHNYRSSAGGAHGDPGWKNLKHDRVGRAGIDSQEDLEGKALAALRRLQKLPHIVRGFFRDPNLRYLTTE